MGFLRRVFGGGSAPEPEQAHLNVTYFTSIRDDAAVQVVGEAYRQGNVALAKPPGPDDLPPGLQAPPPGYFKALLTRDPTNEYDSNAIRVTLWAGASWVLVGYLSRADAIAYQPLFRHLASELEPGVAPAVACDAAMISEGGGRGVVLHLGSPGECAAELVMEGSSSTSHEWVGANVVFTGAGGVAIHGIPLDRPAQLMFAKWAGVDLQPRVTKKTQLLVVSDPDYSTSNLQKAKEYGIRTIQEWEFLYAIGVPPTSVTRVAGRWARG